MPGIVWFVSSTITVASALADDDRQGRELPDDTVEPKAARGTVAIATATPVVVIGVDVGPATGVWVVPARLANANIRKIALKATVVSVVAATSGKNFRDSHFAPFSTDGGAMREKRSNQLANNILQPTEFI
jgi:hypothetical protein